MFGKRGVEPRCLYFLASLPSDTNAYEDANSVCTMHGIPSQIAWVQRPCCCSLKFFLIPITYHHAHLISVHWILLTYLLLIFSFLPTFLLFYTLKKKNKEELKNWVLEFSDFPSFLFTVFHNLPCQFTTLPHKLLRHVESLCSETHFGIFVFIFSSVPHKETFKFPKWKKHRVWEKIRKTCISFLSGKNYGVGRKLKKKLEEI